MSIRTRTTRPDLTLLSVADAVPDAAIPTTDDGHLSVLAHPPALPPTLVSSR